ncbi:phage virion morphogenesis family protein [Burkholderia thailandensis MSMB121]|nr:phage virion morphogenesis family protein [Burkholderia thailandensis MSMB121]
MGVGVGLLGDMVTCPRCGGIFAIVSVKSGLDMTFGDDVRRMRRVKREATFRKLRTARYLRIDVDSASLAIGFDERLSRIARVHQEGQKAFVEPGGPFAQYPVRVVLGFADADRELVRDRLLRYLQC